MNLTRRLASLLALLALTACGDKPSTQTDPGADEPKIQAANELAHRFGAALLGELNGALDKGDAAGAVGMCSERAPALTLAGSSPDFTVRRIGTRTRNKKTNTPDAEGKAILEAFDQLPPDKLAKAREVRTVDGRWRLYLPIMVQSPVCLRCHGPVDQIDAAVRSKLAELYPDDEATGYSIGDLRGAFVVEAVR